MHICIDGNEANVENRVGSNVYAYEVLRHLAMETSKASDTQWTILLRNQPLDDLPPEQPNWQYQVIGPKPFWTQLALPIHLYLNKNSFDVFFSPGHYAPFVCPIPSVTTVMDTAYLAYPEHFKKQDHFQLTYWTKKAVANARKVIAISKATKQSILTTYHKKKEDVVVAYPGYSHQPHTLSDVEAQQFAKRHQVTEPYILFVGTLQPRKNVAELVAAFEVFRRMVAGRNLKKTSRSKKKDTPTKLVLAGKVGWLADDTLARIAASPLNTDIIQTGYISEAEKQYLYKHAMATVLLGEHEGFGLPPLESMAHGTPVVVADHASLPEVVGSVGATVDPHNHQAIAEAIYEIYSMTARQRAQYRKKALEQSHRFDWQETARTILKTLAEVYKETHGN